jgi:outer membrane biosynthesis protein TonB
MTAYVPPGWPSGVHPPGTEEFERTAQAWLLDVVPADYRLHGVLRRYPLALAAMAAHHTKACVAGAREGYRNARTEVGGALPPHALEALLAAYRAEGRRLVATAQAVDLVARALRGEVFTQQLQDATQRETRRPAASTAAERQAAQRPQPEQPAAQQPVTQQPVTQQPVTQQPVTQQPVTQQPVTQQPAARQPAEQKVTGRPGKTRKAPAQRPARNGGAGNRKAKRDQHAAAS